MVSIAFPIIFLGIVALAIASLGFWIWMFIDCLTKEPSDSNEKLLWAIIIFFGSFLGALLYFVIRRPERIANFGE